MGGPTYVTVDDARLWSIAFGPTQADVIVAVGGWIGSWELWAGPLGELSARWRTIAFDHRGSGASIADASSITAERLADDVVAVMDAHSVDRCVLAGESQGAGVVVEAAARYPDRVSGLVLVDGFLPDGPRTLSDPYAVALRDDYGRTIDDFVAACLPDPRHDALRHWGRLILDRTTSEHAIALYLAGAADARPWLPSIQAPTLVIHCDGDRIAPLEDGRALAAAIATSTLRILAGDEHVPTMTRPTEIAALIEAWIAGLGRSFRSSPARGAP